jgi:hypothetical protein
VLVSVDENGMKNQDEELTSLRPSYYLVSYHVFFPSFFFPSFEGK